MDQLCRVTSQIFCLFVNFLLETMWLRVAVLMAAVTLAARGAAVIGIDFGHNIKVGIIRGGQR